MAMLYVLYSRKIKKCEIACPRYHGFTYNKQTILIRNLQEEHPLVRTCLCSSIYKILPSTSCVHSFSLLLVCNQKPLFGLGIILL